MGVYILYSRMLNILKDLPLFLFPLESMGLFLCFELK